jgi:hypothetical protein
MAKGKNPFAEKMVKGQKNHPTGNASKTEDFGKKAKGKSLPPWLKKGVNKK